MMSKFFLVLMAGAIAAMMWALIQPSKDVDIEIFGESSWAYTCQEWATECVAVNCVSVPLIINGTVIMNQQCDSRCELVEHGDSINLIGSNEITRHLGSQPFTPPKIECTITNDGPKDITARLIISNRGDQSAFAVGDSAKIAVGASKTISVGVINNER